MALLTNASRIDDVENGWYQIYCTVSEVAFMSMLQEIQKATRRTKLGPITTLFNSQSEFGPFQIRLKTQAAYLLLDEGPEESDQMQLGEESAERTEALRQQFSDADELRGNHDDVTAERMLCLRPQLQSPSLDITTIRHVVVPMFLQGSVSELTEDKGRGGDRYSIDDPCQGKSLGEECQTFHPNIPDEVIAQEAGRHLPDSEVQKWKADRKGRCHMSVPPKHISSNVVDPETPLSYASARRFYLPSLWKGLLGKLLQPLYHNTDSLSHDRGWPQYEYNWQLVSRTKDNREFLNEIYNTSAETFPPTPSVNQVMRFTQAITARYWNGLRHSAKFLVEEHVLPFLYSLQTTHNLQEAVREYCDDLHVGILFPNGDGWTKTSMKEFRFAEDQPESDRVWRRFVDDWKRLLNGDYSHGEKPALAILINLFVWDGKGLL